MAVLIGAAAVPANAGSKPAPKYVPPPKYIPIIICKPTPVPLPASLPAGLVLFGAVGVIAYRQRNSAQV